MTACIFCEIAAGERPAARVLEEERLVAFLDIRPLFPGHVLLVPRDHHETLTDLPADLAGPLTLATQRLSRAVVAALGAEGFFIAMNNKVSQSVPHLHVHVVPRRRKDGLKGFFWPRHAYPSNDEMERVAALIRDQLA
jgi:histidine triad (HIT) family protein